MKSVKRAVRGYVLLEALVALLIFSLGLLGMIGFQAASTRIVTDTRFRTEAAILVDELISKMSVDQRVNLASRYVYDSSTGVKGAATDAWFTDRVVGASKLPNAGAKVEVVNGEALDTMAVTVTLTWVMPGAIKASSTAKEKEQAEGKYVTSTLLY
ncbi:hypothetical protein [Zoogloea sp.]|uniref:type IV pilus modification PilV family protein n=1 Tax=Zoogloea sp. TaxID=49181 RepID=UPI001415F740|nr:MAG: pilus assembly protein PilV [Zoogloea sp.]